MVTLFPMTASIYDGIIHEGTPVDTDIELVRPDSPDEMAQFLNAGDHGDKSGETLKEANNLITPIMEYIRQTKGIQSMLGSADILENATAEVAVGAAAPPMVKVEGS